LTVFVSGINLNIQSAECEAEKKPTSIKTWQIGTPIVNYWAGPPMSDAVAQQMADGGWNLVWSTEKELDVCKRHDLRAMLHDGLLSPKSLDDPIKRAQLDSLINRVKDHPAMYSYHLKDEPNTSAFSGLGKLVEYLRQRDPAHMAYINLLPTYATNEQLGTLGDTITAYNEYLRRYVEIVNPALISYDHYHFSASKQSDEKFKGTPYFSNGDDGREYFLNLALIRRASQKANVPFLNIVQACSWTPSMRVPNEDEMRFLVYTTLAYGGQGISYYVYCYPGHIGAIANPDGTPTVIYHALKTLNREFVAIASQLQPLRSLGVYHIGMVPMGGEPLPASSAFNVDPQVTTMIYTPPEKMKGMVLGTFGTSGQPTHVLVVNLDYTQKIETTVVGYDMLEIFDPGTGKWETSNTGKRMPIQLLPGGGKLLRVQPHF